MQTATIQADGSAIECVLVPWDSDIFGFPVAQISHIEIGDQGTASGILQQFDAWCAQYDVRLVSCRLDHTQLRESMTLEDSGFRFVEMVYEPQLESFDGLATPRQRVNVAKAAEGELGSIQAIAHSAFMTGRFLLDWRLPPELSKRRYATWVRNSFEASDQTVLKAEVDGYARLGFLFYAPQMTFHWLRDRHR